jgi:predicted MFS family arabinose efflux permease
MTLSYKARRRWSLVLLLVGLPLYIAVALFVVSLFDRPPFWLEFLVYVFLGFLWMLPFKFVFIGVGKPDPDASPATAKEKAGK